MARKQKKYHFIYKTTNLLSGKYYYGMHSTDNLEDGYMGSGKRLRYSLNKYGIENHKREIIEFCNNREELKKREEEIVDLNEVAKEDCMNLIVGGHGGFSREIQMLGNKKSGENRKKIMDENKEFGERMREILRNNSRNAHKNGNVKPPTFKGRKHTEETKRKMSETSKGMGSGTKNSQYGTCWITKDGENKKIKKDLLSEYVENGWVRGRK